jgi:hypothetical protein
LTPFNPINSNHQQFVILTISLLLQSLPSSSSSSSSSISLSTLFSEKDIINFLIQNFERLKRKKEETERLSLQNQGFLQSLLKKFLSSKQSFTNWKLFQPLSFDKDNFSLKHIDFIKTTANLRSNIYNLKEVDFLETQRIAGNIIPAIATTTSLIAGFVSLELLKYVKIKISYLTEIEEIEKEKERKAVIETKLKESIKENKKKKKTFSFSFLKKKQEIKTKKVSSSSSSSPSSSSPSSSSPSSSSLLSSEKGIHKKASSANNVVSHGILQKISSHSSSYLSSYFHGNKKNQDSSLLSFLFERKRSSFHLYCQKNQEILLLTFKNSFLNLANNFYSFVQPVGVSPLSIVQINDKPSSFTIWDEIKIPSLYSLENWTIQDFLSYFQYYYSLQIASIAYKDQLLYSSILQNKKTKKKELSRLLKDCVFKNKEEGVEGGNEKKNEEEFIRLEVTVCDPSKALLGSESSSSVTENNEIPLPPVLLSVQSKKIKKNWFFPF